MLASVSLSSMTGESDCPPAIGTPTPPVAFQSLRAERRPFDSIESADWDALVDANPWSTPFSRWALHRAWWDGYGANAHEETLVVVSADPRQDDRIVGIVPLMHRHEVEPDDLERRTSIRHQEGSRLTPVPPDAKAVFFGASYHADYATLLAASDDLPAVADAAADYLAHGEDPGHPAPWDAVDLRRLRCVDASAVALERPSGVARRLRLDGQHRAGGRLPGRDAARGRLVRRLPRHSGQEGAPRDPAQGATCRGRGPDPAPRLDRPAGRPRRRSSTCTSDAGATCGLFPDTPGGDQSRVFAHRMFELFGADGPLRLSFLTVGERRIAAGITFETPDTIFYYNAGVDPDARELSPGVLMVERYMRRAIERGIPRVDFLRGDEPYKYEWGAVDEPIQRVLVRRTEQR